jgi:4-oxalocrotonate tautomerase
MPFVTIELIEGRSLEQKREMVRRISEVVADVCQIPESRVHLFIRDLRKDQYGNDGILVMDRKQEQS